MQHHLSLQIPPLDKPIVYTDKILLIGSCFTEHISERLARHKFQVLDNPHGILFNPLSVAHSLESYIHDKRYEASDLFQLNELWNSWDHHTRFSDIDKEAALAGINDAQQQAAAFIRTADRVMITLGSAFQYYLKEGERPVANNHRAPGQWFEKRLLPIEVITDRLSATLEALFILNPKAEILFTISPVRHIRDGVVDNNRSKARLIESVHELCARFTRCHYFPAYELVIDILRDYRYYDIDFVHPNYLATETVWEHFIESCMNAETRGIMEEVNSIVTAAKHRPRFPETQAHQSFRSAMAEKIKKLKALHPFLDLGAELAYFTE